MEPTPTPTDNPAPTPTATKGWKKKAADSWKTLTEWLTKKSATADNPKWHERPVVKWGIVAMIALLVIGVPLAFVKRIQNNTPATVAGDITTSEKIIRFADAPKTATSTPTKNWTESSPDDTWNLAGTSEVTVPPDKDIVLVTPVHTDQKVEVVSGLNFEYAYNINTLQKPVWANAEILAQMSGRGQRIENKAYRFKTGKWPLILRFEITPKKT